MREREGEREKKRNKTNKFGNDYNITWSCLAVVVRKSAQILGLEEKAVMVS